MLPISRWATLLLLGSLVLNGEPPAESKPKSFTQQQRRYWAFQPIVAPPAPAVKSRSWVANDIDTFVLAKLEENHLTPNPPADKIILLRRAHLTLTGIPPTAEETHAFLSDNSPQAFEKVVDRLLASPHYGERWARHWLDVARYADSEGFKADETRPNIWRYRDYVIRAFNSDKPYDRFLQEQIAGDELFPGDPDALTATGFNRHFPDESNQVNIFLRRQELLNDITDTVGAAVMGLTVGCARCHDHKFDPILHKDYYRLQAFFANLKIDDELVLADQQRRQEYARKQAVWSEKTASIRAQLAVFLKPRYEARYQERLGRFPEEIQQIIVMPPDKRNPYEWQMFHKAKTQLETTEKEAVAGIKGDDAKRYKALKAELAKYDDLKPEELPVAQGMVDNGTAVPKIHVLRGGAYNSPEEQVEPGFLTILDPNPAKIVPVEGSTGRRAALARWFADSANPLTARVMVNRVWHHHFGRGIVETPNDFGVMGGRPSHRELLDSLAAGFMRDGWSLKKLHRRILLSKTWQQSSAHRVTAAAIDPNNRYLWRYPRHRLEGEAIRDAMLAVSGSLNTKMYGPGVFPPLPPGMVTRGGWKADEDAAESNRRSVYVFVRRNTRYPMFEAFDMPDTHESCGRRNTTVSSTQALELLNNEVVVSWAKALAARVRNDSGLTTESQVERAWKLVYSREPSAKERESALAFLNRQATVAGSADAAFLDFCHMLLNSNEFVYVN